jgi:hypothetical protein
MEPAELTLEEAERQCSEINKKFEELKKQHGRGKILGIFRKTMPEDSWNTLMDCYTTIYEIHTHSYNLEEGLSRDSDDCLWHKSYMLMMGINDYQRDFKNYID